MLGMLWVVGAPARIFVGRGQHGRVVALFLAASSPERLYRLTYFVNPFHDFQNAGWQSGHGILGMASGGLFGKGIGASQQKWGNLPEPHTDFIFAVLGEELGLVGTLLVLALFLAIAYAGIRIAMQAHDPFVRYMAAGITIWLTAQVMINIGMVLALLPVIGIPLPLVSYGGSSLVPELVAIGLLISFARHEPAAARELRRPPSRRRGARRHRPPRAGATPVGQMMRVLLAGGGTAGHTSPLLATADALRRRDPVVEITALGTPRGLENRVVPAAGYPLELVPPVPLSRKLDGDLLRTPAPAARRRQGRARGARPGAARRGRRVRRLRLRAGLPRRPRRAAPDRGPRGQRPRPASPTSSAPGSPRSSRPASRAPSCRTPSTSGCRSGG